MESKLLKYIYFIVLVTTLIGIGFALGVVVDRVIVSNTSSSQEPSHYCTFIYEEMGEPVKEVFQDVFYIPLPNNTASLVNDDGSLLIFLEPNELTEELDRGDRLPLVSVRYTSKGVNCRDDGTSYFYYNGVLGGHAMPSQAQG